MHKLFTLTYIFLHLIFLFLTTFFLKELTKHDIDISLYKYALVILGITVVLLIGLAVISKIKNEILNEYKCICILIFHLFITIVCFIEFIIMGYDFRNSRISYNIVQYIVVITSINILINFFVWLYFAIASINYEENLEIYSGISDGLFNETSVENQLYTNSTNEESQLIINLDDTIFNPEHDLTLCCICKGKTADTTLVPCNHNNFCYNCIDTCYQNHNHKSCPICRTKITSLVKAY